MKVFPSKNYKIELVDNSGSSIENLRLRTLESDSLSTQITAKDFIGKIKGNEFQIIGSEIGIGAVSVLKGKFASDFVEVNAEINKPFKILISIIFIFGILGISFCAVKNGFPRGLGMLVPLIMFLGFIRLVFLGLFFKISSNLIFNKFCRILKIKSIENFA